MIWQRKLSAAGLKQIKAKTFLHNTNHLKMLQSSKTKRLRQAHEGDIYQDCKIQRPHFSPQPEMLPHLCQMLREVSKESTTLPPCPVCWFWFGLGFFNVLSSSICCSHFWRWHCTGWTSGLTHTGSSCDIEATLIPT